MTPENIESDFKKTVCDGIRLMPEGKDRFRVLTPFHFDDGDLLAVTLKKDGSRWGLTDDGSTFMRLTYDMDDKTIMTGSRGEIIEGAIESNGIENKGGVLWSMVDGNAYGDALYSFIRAVLRISDVHSWSKAAVRSTFIADLQAFVGKSVPPDTTEFNWHDPLSDPKGVYPVDCRINRVARPLFLFGIQSDDKCATATIVIQHYQQSGVLFDSVAVFEDQESIGRKQVARLTDVVGKQFSSLSANQKQLAAYLRDQVGSSTSA